MKFYILILIPLFIWTSPAIAQTESKGKFSKTVQFAGREDYVPVGKHTFSDEASTYQIKYDKTGTIKKLVVRENNASSKFPIPAYDKIEWEEIVPGVWINKTKDESDIQTEFDKDMLER